VRFLRKRTNSHVHTFRKRRRAGATTQQVGAASRIAAESAISRSLNLSEPGRESVTKEEKAVISACKARMKDFMREYGFKDFDAVLENQRGYRNSKALLVRSTVRLIRSEQKRKAQRT
jgi:hypothetical protein